MLFVKKSPVRKMLYSEVLYNFHHICSLVVCKEEEGKGGLDSKVALLEIKFPIHRLLLRCQS